MLVLTRREGETLRIGEEVKIVVLGVQGTQVKLGISAPHEIAVHREEIYRRIQHERTQPKDNATAPFPSSEESRRTRALQ